MSPAEIADKLILYHANCLDGFTSAWVAHRAILKWWRSQDISEGSSPPVIDCIPLHYKQLPPDVTGKDVYICDFSFPREILLDMHSKAARLVVLDHHKTAKQDLEGLDFCIFDMDRSGAAITWDYFHNNNKPGERPWLINYVQDRDLWQWRLPESKEISASLMNWEPTFEEWDVLAKQRTPTSLVLEGRTILKYQRSIISHNKKRAYLAEFEGQLIPVINIIHLYSEITNEISEGYPYAISWSYVDRGHYHYSLRTRDDTVDVSEIAKKYGGGGHPQAASFTSKQFLLPAIRPLY